MTILVVVVVFKLRHESYTNVKVEIYIYNIFNSFRNTSDKIQRFLTYLFLQMLYMIQAVPPPIIRST